MLFDDVRIVNTVAVLTGAKVPSGAVYPSTPVVGQLFFHSVDGLRVWGHNSTWDKVGL